MSRSGRQKSSPLQTVSRLDAARMTLIRAACMPDKRSNAVEIPVSPATRIKIRPSKAGRWRAVVLIAVQLLIAVHVAHWMSTGWTLSPLEPSEAMEFSKRSIVNAGLVFFALSIGSTLLLGRWFCGWACHLVALQDLCRWLLLKLGIRPRMVKLGVLGTVPWLAFAYMFLAPLLQRVLHGDYLAMRGVELYKADFWATFPNWQTGVATLLVCGFATVYFLGSKGFCTYGCPYGAIFAIADQLAPIRIRVTDACEGCGHCTAVCSSNVQVHREVRDYKMVVDAGCMKCLDCVSVCPTNALYVGFGAPAIAARARGPAQLTGTPVALKRLPAAASRTGETLGNYMFLAVFFAATFTIFLTFDSDPERILEPGKLLATLTVLSLLVARVFRGKAQRASDYSFAEQALLAGFFLLAILTFRGFTLLRFGGKGVSVPFLFALGLSTTLAYVCVQALRLVYRPDVLIQGLALRVRRRLTRAGVAFAIAMAPVGWFWAHAGIEQQRGHAIRLAREAVDQGLRRASDGQFEDAIAALRRALDLVPGDLEARNHLAGVLCASGRLHEGIAQYEISLAQAPLNPNTHALVARAWLGLNRPDKAREHLERAVTIAPARADLRRALADVCRAVGDVETANRHDAEARRLDPGAPR
jgi:ferredoxin-type protein NapH